MRWRNRSTVLILVLVEVTLWDTRPETGEVMQFPSLNPCFRGSYSLRPVQPSENPIYSVLILVLVEVTLWAAVYDMVAEQFDNVLILVLVEVTLWETEWYTLAQLTTVS